MEKYLKISRKIIFFYAVIFLLFSSVSTAMPTPEGVGTESFSGWAQFQKDAINSGITCDTAPVSDATVSWKQQVGSTGMAGIDTSSIIAEEKIFVLDALGEMWGFDAETGDKIWQTDLSCTGMLFQLSTPAYAAGKIFAATNDGHVYALDAANGSQIWANETASAYDQLNTPVKYADGKIYIGSWNGKIYYCLDVTDGHVVWNRPSTSGRGYYWAGACAIGDYLIYGDDASILTCVNKDTGLLVDEENLKDVDSGAGEIRSSVTYSESAGRVYFTCKGGNCWAYNFNSATGTLTYQWHVQIGYSTSSPVIYDDRVYVGKGGFSSQGGLCCLTEAAGEEIWAFIPNGGVQSSPALSVQGEQVYIYFTSNCTDGTAYCLDEDGTEMWHFTSDEAGTSGGYTLQGMAIYNDRIYFGNAGGRLYALSSDFYEDWDVNEDGSVNMLDIILVGQHFSETGAPGWIREDVNDDGSIDMLDIILVGQHFSF